MQRKFWEVKLRWIFKCDLYFHPSELIVYIISIFILKKISLSEYISELDNRIRSGSVPWPVRSLCTSSLKPGVCMGKAGVCMSKAGVCMGKACVCLGKGV